ncbi:MAG: CHAT domain-containing protein, partial [Nonlabens sp.]|nr:CHAT domain-containing protein [Nonlabens sp.]
LRYFFMEEELFVFVISKSQKKLVKLDTANLEMHINNLSEQWQDAQATGERSHRLYQQLWKPFAQDIKTNKVVIIPDGMLYNLSFEMLAQTAVTDFKELSKKSLLAKYTISYNFSSLMLDKRRDPHFFDSNYVGFAPGFTTVMKDGYSVQVTDSLAVDKTYLSLVKQPFITKITKDYSRRFNGKSFLNENASKSVFLENAREHKIIHIGTHAESNNIYPELSRLIFAKELDSDATNLDIEDNSLYTYEIYNTNLAANLAILTACETGKPEFQAGEGMISLAHAFTYAGSESILTSLWQIDEQSSAQLVSLFYENLKEGMPKDKALQQAKLTYLATARGRTASPQYWAGMVLMGDTSPIDFTTGMPSWIYWCAGIVLAGILIWFIARRRSRRL